MAGWVAAPLLLVAVPVAAQASPADEAVAAARQAAGENRHADAVAAYRRAIAAAPERRGEWLLDLADQLTWNDRLAEAIALYREAVAAAQDETVEIRARTGLARALSWQGKHDDALAEYDRALAIHPADLDVRLARAEVLAWDDRLGAALAAYDAVLHDEPDDRAAQRGRARVLSWRGRHRAAVAALQPLLAAEPGDREAIAILAESLGWMGRPDRAERVLRGHFAADPEDSRAAALLADLEHRQRPELRFDWREFDQSDELRITELTLDARVPLRDGRGFAGARYVHALFRPPGGDAARRITVHRPGVLGGYRLSDAVELTGAFSLDVIDTAEEANDRVLPTFDAYLTWRPDDRFRVDVGGSRWTFDSEEALREGLTATQGGGSLDFAPDERTLLSARFGVADYSDGNARTWWQVQANRRLLNRPRIVVAYRYTGFDFTQPGQGGYYNPDWYHGHELLLTGSGQLARRLRWDIRLAGGIEDEPAGTRPTVNAGVSLARDIAQRVEIEAAYDFSTSRTLSTGGFERNIARLTLRGRL